ncbi:hypothetical protein OY671_010227, partial [Metschnikowia pulcherrima]
FVIDKENQRSAAPHPVPFGHEHLRYWRGDAGGDRYRSSSLDIAGGIDEVRRRPDPRLGDVSPEDVAPHAASSRA